MYGDVKLEKVSDSSTRVTLVGLSPTEKEAAKALFKRATKPGLTQKAWATDSDLGAVDLGSLKEQSFLLTAPISQVQSFLQKTLKPHRKQLSVVRFTSGRIEELSEATLQVIDSTAAVTVTEEPDKPAEPKKKEDKPEKAVTVSQPVLGCPAPDFDDVDVRATRVLCAFLTPEQIEDFGRRQQFVAVGADTGHRYLLTSRHSKHGLLHSSYRSLYDMDERTALCVHDWEVPAAEELLALLVHISIPNLERYVRTISDREGVLG